MANRHRGDRAGGFIRRSLGEGGRALFPPPRRPVTWRQAVPPAAFLAAFAAAVLLLTRFDVLAFSRPRGFLVLAVAPWVWWMDRAGWSGLSRARAATALFLRFLFVALFAVALAEPRAVRVNRMLSVVYAVDLSDSIGQDASNRALEFVVGTVSGKPEKDEAGLVVFGRNAAVELPPRMSFPFEVVNSRVERDGTNIEKALSLSAAMLPDDRSGRIVLVTDGTATEGNLPGALDLLASRKIPVDVLPVEYAFDQEAWLERLDLPRFVKLGETYEASVLLSSLREGAGTLVLRENGATVYRDRVTYGAGKSRFVFPLHWRTPGFYEYQAEIEPDAGGDARRENNLVMNSLAIQGKGRVLLVLDPDADPRDWRRFAEALGKGDRVVDEMTAWEVPRDPLAFMPYDTVVFLNVPADRFDLVQMQAVHDAVYHQGVGFLMVGGENSFGPGGYRRTPVEQALPVDMDISQKKVLPKGALVICLHTCEFAQGNTWGKRIAKEAIRVLGDRDEAGVIVYTSGAQWLFPLTPAAEYDRLATLINSASIGDMPSFGEAMLLGLQALQASDAAARHMIIISDGDPSPPTPDLVSAFVAARISISTVAVNPHDQENNRLMRTIAMSTGGRFFFPQDPALLPSIFVKEAKTLRRTLIENREFVPEAGFPSPVLKGIDTLPPLRGYVLTTPKPRSLTVLTAAVTEDRDPILSTWRYGVGETAAFTSDLSPNWGARWLEWDRYDAFVQQLLTTLSRTRSEGALVLRCVEEGSTALIQAEDLKGAESFLAVEAAVSGPRGRTETMRLPQVAMGRYAARLPLWGRGRYTAAVVGEGPGREERAVGGFTVSYSPEYLRFRSSPLVLDEIRSRTGGRLLSGTEKGNDIFVGDREARKRSAPIPAWFLWALAFLVPVDVAVRRVHVSAAEIRARLFNRRGAETSETMGRLLRRKQGARVSRERHDAAHIGSPADSDARRTPAPPPVDAPQPAATDAAAGEKAPAAAGPTPEADAGHRENGGTETKSTTSRLLDAKRRKQQRDKEERKPS